MNDSTVDAERVGAAAALGRYLGTPAGRLALSEAEHQRVMPIILALEADTIKDVLARAAEHEPPAVVAVPVREGEAPFSFLVLPSPESASTAAGRRSPCPDEPGWVADRRRREAREHVIVAALGLLAARGAFELHPEDPHGDAHVGMNEDILDDALRQYAAAARTGQW